MKLILLLLGLIYILIAEAKQIPKVNIDIGDESVDADELNNFKDYQTNHRRHKRQFDRGYFTPSHYDNYQDVQIALLKEKIESLQKENEIRSRINMSPQIVYVPVPYPVPQYAFCPPVNNNSMDLNNRFMGSDEENELKKIWNFQEDAYGNGQVSFRPRQPSRPVAAQPPVEHGTVQDGVTTAAPFTIPGPCDVAILICCKENRLSRQNCFVENNCSSVYKTGLACLPKTIDGVIKKFAETYA